MTAVTFCHGTWGWPKRTGDWWCGESDVIRFLRVAADIAPLRPDDPFSWSGDCNGGVRWPWNDRDHTDWQAGGKALRWYLREGGDYVPIHQRRIVSHSHGMQCVLYACADGLKIDRLLSITGPIRADMAAVAKAARPNIGQWWHVHADNDKTQILGALFDGVWGIHRAAPLADQNISIPGIGHSGLLREPHQFHWWIDAGLTGFLSEPTA